METYRDVQVESDGVSRHVECRISDKIYVYLYSGDVRVETQHVDIPAGWWEAWPSESTVRRHIRRCADIGAARITSIVS